MKLQVERGPSTYYAVKNPTDRPEAEWPESDPTTAYSRHPSSAATDDAAARAQRGRRPWQGDSRRVPAAQSSGRGDERPRRGRNSPQIAGSASSSSCRFRAASRVVATAATEDEALRRLRSLYDRALRSSTCQLAQGTGFGVIRRPARRRGIEPRPASWSSPTTRCPPSRSPRSKRAPTTSSTRGKDFRHDSALDRGAPSTTASADSRAASRAAKKKKSDSRGDRQECLDGAFPLPWLERISSVPWIARACAASFP